MSNKTTSRCNNLLGNIFDLNGDGVTDAFETALMLTILDQEEQEERDACSTSSFYINNITDLDDLDIKGL